MVACDLRYFQAHRLYNWSKATMLIGLVLEKEIATEKQMSTNIFYIIGVIVVVVVVLRLLGIY